MNLISEDTVGTVDSFPLSMQQVFLLGRERALGRPLLAGALIDLPTGCSRTRIESALATLAIRHEILRTRFVRIPGLKLPLQSIRPNAAVDCAAWSGPADLAALLDRARAQIGEEAVPLIAAVVDDGERLFLAAPLYGLDRHSLARLSRELWDLLQGGLADAEDGLHYADYAVWQNDLLALEAGDEGRAFWRGLLDSASAPVELPFARDAASGPPARTSLRIAELPRRLAAAAGQLGVPEDQLLGFLWSAFVGRLAGAERLLCAFAIDGRAEETRDTAGPFARLMPVAVDLSAGSPWHQSLQAFVGSVERSLAWRDCLSESDLLAEDGRLRVACAFTCEGPLPAGVTVVADDPDAARLHLTYRPSAVDAELEIGHSGQAFDPAMPAVWLGQLSAFLDHALADPDRLLGAVGLLGEAERCRLQEFAATAPTPENPLPLHQLFERQVDAAPARVALRCGQAEVTYGELEARANAVADWLTDRGVGTDGIVGVYGGRGVGTIAAMLGILKAGGAYLPLDPTLPAERLALMVAETRAAIVLATEPMPSELKLGETVLVAEPGEGSPARREHPVDPAGLAYVIYTSGSTGRPKGVMVSHANAAASLAARLAFYRDPISAFLLLSPLSFDSSVAGLFWTLAQGGTLILPDAEEQRDPERIAALIGRHAVSHYLTLPSVHAQLLETPFAHQLRCVIVAGEACPGDLPRRHAARLPGVALVNEYGPTEASVWCTAWQAHLAPGDTVVAIGRPIAGARVHILDGALDPAPLGMDGEIWVAGAGLARGYLERPGLTAERFVPDPHGEAGDRLYRTGDLGRYRPDGTIEYRGRSDDQLKIRGFRIEPGEIEAALRRCDGVKAAAVVARDTPTGKELVGFVVGEDDASDGTLADKARATLAETLPEFMLPARLRRIEVLPTNVNGKLDREALLALDTRSRDYVAPRTELERALADSWAEALSVERVGMHDNFFELGGHSLLAAKLRTRIQSRLGVALPLRLFFEGDTLEQFAAKVVAHRDRTDGDARLDAFESLLVSAEAS